MADPTKKDPKKPAADPKKPAADAKKGRAGGITGGLWWAFAAVGLFYLLTDRVEHFYDYLPYLMLMSCPVIDIFRRNSGFRRGDVARLKQGAPWE